MAELERQLKECGARTDACFDRIEEHLTALLESGLERRHRERASAYFGTLLRRVWMVDDWELEDLLDEGVAAGTVDAEEAYDLRFADVIVRGPRRGDDRETYLVVEVSVAIDRDDVERAARRAAALGRLRPTLAVVAGDRLTTGATELANVRGVWQVLDGRVVAPSSAA